MASDDQHTQTPSSNGDASSPKRRQATAAERVQILQAANIVARRLTSDRTARHKFSQLAGKSFWNPATAQYDRDLWAELGYPRELKPKHYRERYERGGIAERLVELLPQHTWANGGPNIADDPDPENITDFEASVMELAKTHSVWNRMLRADILSGLGRYAVILIGCEGSTSDPLPTNLQGPEDILYLTPRGEEHAEVESLVTDEGDRRFGLPEYYKIEVGDDKRSKKIKAHWSRVIHIADGCLDDDLYGKPVMRSVWNLLNDLYKVTGGGAEAAWNRMDPGLHMDLDPEIQVTEDEEEKLLDQYEEYRHGLSRLLRTRGMDVNQLSSDASQFGGNADEIRTQIAGAKGIPKRILFGSERGQLASSQDRSNFKETVSGRQEGFGEHHTRLLLDRLIEAGALAAPLDDDYDVTWPTLGEKTDSEKAEEASTLASANKAQKEAEGRVLLTGDEIREQVYGYGPLADVIDIDAEADEELEEDLAQARRLAETADEEPDEPEWKAVHRAADAHRDKVMSLFLAFWVAVGGAVNADAVERALAMNNQMGAARLVNEAHAAVAEGLREELTELLLDTLVAGAEATRRSARAAGTWFRGATHWADAPMRSLDDGPFGIAFDRTNQRAVEWAEAESSRLITEVTEEQKRAMRTLIAEGIEEGIPPRVLRQRITQLVGLRSDQTKALKAFERRLKNTKPGNLVKAGGKRYRVPEGGFSKARREQLAARYETKLHNDRGLLIGRTETMRSANQGQRMLWTEGVAQGQLPAGTKRKWIVTPDSRLRDKHARMAGQERGLEEPFEAPTGEQIEPGEEPNCRCGQGLVPPSESIRPVEAGGGGGQP